jgi:ferritin-like metal-binding protein YciE
MGQEDVVSLLEENLEQEKHTLDEVKEAAEKLSRELAMQTA